MTSAADSSRELIKSKSSKYRVIVKKNILEDAVYNPQKRKSIFGIIGYWSNVGSGSKYSLKDAVEAIEEDKKREMGSYVTKYGGHPLGAIVYEE